VHNALARSFPARGPPPARAPPPPPSVLAPLTRAGPPPLAPSPRASPGSPFPHPQNIPQGTGSDWKNLLVIRKGLTNALQVIVSEMLGKRFCWKLVSNIKSSFDLVFTNHHN
jgi:hypothetical protein